MQQMGQKFECHQSVVLKPAKALIVGVVFSANRLGGISPFYNLLMADGNIQQMVPESVIDRVDVAATAEHAREIVQFRNSDPGQDALANMEPSETALARAVNAGLGHFEVIAGTEARPVGETVTEERRVAGADDYQGEERREERLQDAAQQKWDAYRDPAEAEELAPADAACAGSDYYQAGDDHNGQ